MSDNRDSIDQTEETTGTGEARQVTESAATESLRDAVGAYVLDALPDDERQAFEAFLAISPETQADLHQLAPVVTLLPKLLEEETAAPAPTPASSEPVRDEAEPEPKDDVDSAPATEGERAAGGEGRSRTIRTAPQGTGPFEHKRRPRQSMRRAASARTAPAPLEGLSRIPAPWLTAAALAVIAVGAIIWALALESRIDSKNREIAAQAERLVSLEADVAELRRNANATAFTLSASDAAAGNARGTLLFSPREQIGILYVRGLPPLADGRVYQVWYLDDQGGQSRAGATFRVDRNGNAMIAVESDAPTFDSIAVSDEPEGGSSGPTGSIMLQGRLGGAAG